jgi:hypothetical protein
MPRQTTAMVRRFPGDRLVIASHNKPASTARIAALLAPFGLEVAAGELGLPEPEETGATFARTPRSRPAPPATAPGCRPGRRFRAGGAGARRRGRASTRRAGFGVYVHWPFCQVEVPLLRLQQPCPPRRSTRRAGARAAGRARPLRGRTSGPAAHLDVLRRRHALADAAGDRRRRDRRASPALAASPRTSRSRWRPTRPRSRPPRFAASRAGVNRCRSACRRSTTRRCASSAASTAAERAGGRAGARHLPASPST